MKPKIAPVKLTKSVVENIKLPGKGQIFLWDSELKGFGVRCTPTARTYIVQGRVSTPSGTKDRRVTLGRHGVLTVLQARHKAQAELVKLSEGKDPSTESKRLHDEAVTLGQVVEAYLNDRRSLKESSRADILKHLNGSFSDWKDTPITSITRDKVLTRFRELSDRSPAQANQAFRNLRALINYAIGAYRSEGVSIIPENPVKAISDLKMWNHIKPRSGRIPLDKIGAAWNALQELRTAPAQTPISRTMADAVIFLLLTGARWSEMASLTWDRVNLEEGYWYIPDPKNREPVTFPLSSGAVDILKDRPQQGEYIFPALDFWKTKLLMGHKISGDVTIAHYTETSDLRYLTKEINLIGQWITKQGAIEAAGNVVSISAAKGGTR
ncbi:MAG: integrase arm-type DNA-binding domain-containing protein [Deltaproteobacteria bacterium]|nr:integrase arm-type DNA-binding domain-containing protein [Deltaproteobacteria bacterium]